MSNPMFQDDAAYVRNLDVVGSWVREQAKLLSLRSNRDYYECLEFVKKKVETSELKDVQMKILRRDTNGDRIKDGVGFLQYLNWVGKNNHILAPNMISYAHPSIKQSYTALFVDENLKVRKAVKKIMHRAKELGDLETAYFANLEQANKKFFNNSLSGASCSEHNPLYYLTKHTTLTSTCRSCTSSANSINEKLIASNRHYYNYDVTIENIAYILNKTNYEELESVCEEYGVEAPTPSQTKNIIFRSAGQYWRDDTKYAEISSMVDNMSAIERIAVTYTNDLNALCKFSGHVIKRFFDQLIDRSKYREANENVFKCATGDMYTLAGMLCYDFMKGVSPEDLQKAGRVEEFDLFRDTLGQVMRVMTVYGDFFRVFFVNDIMPQNIFEVPYMRRKAVPASDTDSSIYSTQRIVQWYSGKIDFSLESIGAGAITAFISSTMVAHTMLKLSRQLGVSEENKYRISMKGEFYFPVLICTNATKHYAYLTAACEGKIYKAPVLDVKGVNLKNSKLSLEIRNASMSWYESTLKAIMLGRDLVPEVVYSYPAYLEHSIINKIQSGEIEFYGKENAKSKDVYKKPYSSHWAHIDMWNASFAKKYGYINEFPVTAKKIHVNLPNPAAIEAWAKTLDQEIGEGIVKWCKENGKNKLGHILVPVGNMPGGKLPKEFIPIVNPYNLLSEVTGHCYSYMIPFGIHIKTDSNTQFAKDKISLDRAIENLKYLGVEEVESLK